MQQLTMQSTIALAALLTATGAAPKPATGKPAGWRVVAAERLLVSSKDPWRREAAALVLGRRGSRASLALLRKVLRADKNPWVRARAAEAIGMIGDVKGIEPLRGALAREKRPRVRRAVAIALMRLGRKEGLLELMWQLRTGTNHDRADALHALVSHTGRPMGKRPKHWWSYLAAGGYDKLAARPPGTPLVLPLGDALRIDADLGKSGHSLLPAVVLRLGPTRAPIDTRALRRYERRSGRIPDGCLLLLETRHQAAKPDKRPRSNKAGPKGAAAGPGLTLDGARYLLLRAPALLGVGIDTAALSPGGDTGATALLRQKKRAVVTSLRQLEQLNGTGVRVLLLADRAFAIF